MFEKLSDNLNQLMTRARVSADELARQTNIPASTIKKIRNRYNPNPTLATLLPLARFFSVTLGQLTGDEALTENGGGLAATNTHKVPVITWEEATLWSGTTETHRAMTSTDYQCSPRAFALAVEEDDWGLFSKGSLLIVDPAVTATHRDFVISMKVTSKKPTLKQMIQDEEQTYLKPLVAGYPVTTLTDTHKILGVVMEHKKILRQA